MGICCIIFINVELCGIDLCYDVNESSCCGINFILVELCGIVSIQHMNTHMKSGTKSSGVE